MRPALAVFPWCIAALLPFAAAAGEFDGLWLGRMERDFGPLCARTYALRVAVKDERAAGRMIGPQARVALAGAMTADGRLVGLKGRGALRFRLDGRVRDGAILGTWSAIRNSVGDCSGRFMMRRQERE